ncbi:glycine--tRNA ligase subunit beta [Texcoconibacillus texcoconensis]|uniref:Glycine--tRNA ligase beta subunit n=1 Tax=Texcoconibacillus texcoconensis TaxID=1095777 RepID=A0A840QRF3_9BACI|nr:glycine--tRNA ligase subunit beta [Texcoconibacillus texcoconensis]MBB5173929.1 glycyl-tRNA synthetase beta chain [Texcoconibacillus texcoconensis]
MSNRSFLLEIGLEEMPARFVDDAMHQLADRVTTWLGEHRISYGDVEKYATPRRLAVKVLEVAEYQEDLQEEARGPAKKIAQDENGEWTKAAQGFAKGQGVSVDELYFKEVKGESYVFVTKDFKGKETSALLSGLKSVVEQLTFPKNMKWNAYDLRYVRPIHWLVSLYGEEVIPMEITDISASNVTRGHRFLGGPSEIGHADEYETKLLQEFVIPEPNERKEAIRQQVGEIASREGWYVPIDEGLLNEVNQLVEYPTALYGHFDESFLRVPDDVLVTSMKEHQRYFPVHDDNGDLLPYFITVRNGDHRHLENVQKGNEKVLRARLADAEFFYNEDLKIRPDDAVNRLESIVYHEELGTLGDKVRRLRTISEQLADRLQLSSEEKQHLERAAHLSKFDLVTNMVDEFTELEGRMGEEYALKAGEAPEVAKAIVEHYSPKQAKDPVPKSTIGAVLSVADKLDTVIASFGIGVVPTGSQDPHGLRRQTAGVVQILLEQSWQIDVRDVTNDILEQLASRQLLKQEREEVAETVNEFIKQRVKNVLQERGVRYDLISAVLNGPIGRIDRVIEKAEFLQKRVEEEQFKSTVEAFSRVTNISKKSSHLVDVDSSLFTEEQEHVLHEKVQKVEQDISQAKEDADLEGEFAALESLTPVIHDYFDHIMVMTDEKRQRDNRLAQMTSCASLITSFADFQAIVFSS